MRTARFFVPPEWLAISSEAFCIPAGMLHKQIVQVLRMKPGENITLLPNDGTEIDCRITEITRSAVMGVIAGSKGQKPLLPEITVCAAVTKRDTFEWMLQKCTELGATAFLPLHTDRTIKKTPGISKRWIDIIREASEQSGRTTMPTVHEPLAFTKALHFAQPMVKIVMHEAADKKSWPSVHKTSNIALFIGPEGGFSDNEISLAKDADAHIVQLGDLVLRAETAAITGMAKLRLL